MSPGGRMRRVARTVLLSAVGLALGAVAVSALREATLSTHQPVHPDSTMELVVRGRSRNAEQGQTLAEMVRAQLLTCRLEVTSDMVGGLQDLGNGRFGAVFRPAMDETNTRQFRGCVEDFMIDGVQIDVLELEEGPRIHELEGPAGEADDDEAADDPIDDDDGNDDRAGDRDDGRAGPAAGERAHAGRADRAA